MARVVETDNYGGDYPDEQFINVPIMDQEGAKSMANMLNRRFGHTDRYWKVVANDYKLRTLGD